MITIAVCARSKAQYSGFAKKDNESIIILTSQMDRDHLILHVYDPIIKKVDSYFDSYRNKYADIRYELFDHAGNIIWLDTNLVTVLEVVPAQIEGVDCRRVVMKRSDNLIDNLSVDIVSEAF